jgi:hypothetical protein
MTLGTCASVRGLIRRRPRAAAVPVRSSAARKTRRQNVPKPRPWWSESSFKIQEAIIAVGEAIDDEADPDDPEAADVELMIQELREAVDAFERLANAKRAGI